MAEPYLADIVGNFQRGTALGTAQRQEREAQQRQSRLSELASLAYGAQGPERQAAIGQAYGVDPQFAAQLSGQLGKEDEARQVALLQSAKLLQSAPAEARPALYQRIRPSLGQYLPDLPPEYNEQVDAGTKAFITAYGGGGAGDVKVVGNSLVDTSGKVIYQAPQRFQTDTGLVEVGPEGVRELRIGESGQPMQGPVTTNLEGERGRYVFGQDGRPVFIAEGVSPNIEQGITANPAAFEQPTAQAPGVINTPQGRPILPRGAGAEQERLALARQAAANSAEANQRANEAAVLARAESERRAKFGTIPPGFRVNAAGTALEPVPGGPKPAGATATEGERKSATLLKRLEGSLAQLNQAVKENPSAQSPGVIAESARTLPFVGEVAARGLNSSERQRVEAAQLDILDAALTLGTGAAYTKEQLRGYAQSYFPQIGDSQATINDKAARLKNVIEGARIAAGRAVNQVDQPAATSADDALINKYLRP